jgi:hypothetical protein
MDVLNETSESDYILHDHWKQFDPLSGYWYTTLLVVYSLVLAFSLPVSIIVIVYYAENVKIRKTHNFLVINLMVANLVLVFNLPLSIYNSYYGQWMFSNAICYYYGMCSGLFMFVTTLTMTMISIERYLLVKYPYKRFETNKKMSVIMVLVSWAYGGVMIGLPFLAPRAYVVEGTQIICTFDFISKDKRTQTIATVCLVVAFFMPCLLKIVFYSLIVKHAVTKKRHLNSKYRINTAPERKLKNFSSTVPRTTKIEKSKSMFSKGEHPHLSNRIDIDGLEASTNRNKPSVLEQIAITSRKEVRFSTEHRLAFNSFVHVFSFCLVWSPFSYMLLVAQLSPNRTKYLSPEIALFANLLGISSLVINPVVYALTNKECFKSTKRKFSYIYGKHCKLQETMHICHKKH